MPGRIAIGTSGWSYGHWTGTLYPLGLPAPARLAHYAQAFPTVEVNTSHYRLPHRRTVESWARLTPDAFTWTFKGWSYLTHHLRLAASSREVDLFLEAVAPIPRHRRDAILVQLPPSLHHDPDRLEAYLGTLRDGMAKDGPWPLAVEFRHKSWYAAEVSRLLDRLGASQVVHDMRGSATTEPNAAPLVYVRRHGPTGRYRGSYSDAALAADADRIAAWARSGRDVLVYFNNDLGGHAVRNALRLQGFVAERMGLPAPAARAGWPQPTGGQTAVPRPRRPRAAPRLRAPKR